MRHAAESPFVTAESGLARYLEDIRRFPMLEPREEYVLAKRWREQGDRHACHKLVTSHLRLVAKIATRYRGYGLPISEIISEGTIGLMQAVKRFEPERGFRFGTYAIWWIKAAIQEYVLRSWSLVRMGTTANQKKLFFNLRKVKSRISALEAGDLRPDQVKLIATHLGVAEQDVVEMNRRLGGDISLNAPIREDGDAGEWQDLLVDESSSEETRLATSQEFNHRHSALGEALKVLNQRERRIFEARRLADEPPRLHELADEFGISTERVRQIEARAFQKVTKVVKGRLAAMELRPSAPTVADFATVPPPKVPPSAHRRAALQLSPERPVIGRVVPGYDGLVRDPHECLHSDSTRPISAMRRFHTSHIASTIAS
jgi:RNA polymerase sigma-32 factor